MRNTFSPTFGPGFGRGSHPAWSADGQRLAFVDGNDIYTVKPDASDKQLVLDGNMDVIEGISWAPSGDRLVAALGVCDLDECRSDIHVIVLGPSGPQSVVNITPDSFSERNPAWSPDGARIAFDSMRDGNNDVYTMDVDGGNLARLTTNPAGDSDPNWAPSGDALAFTSGRDSTDVIYTMNPDGTAQTRRSHPSLYPSQHPAWTPDGTRIVFSGVRGQVTQPQIIAVTADGATEFQSGGAQGQADYEPDVQPADITYVRPRSASPLRVSLVPSYTGCAAPNRTHGRPFDFGSCSPPVQTSPHITVGTPDANGAPADSVGWVRLRAFESAPGGPVEADMIIELNVSDIRCRSGTAACGPANERAGPDYTGELSIELVAQVTDKLAQGDPQTTQYFTFPVRAGCAATSSTATGSVCSVWTFINSIVPAAVVEAKRTMWEIRQIRVRDGGADGDADTTGDNRVFARQGVFVP